MAAAEKKRSWKDQRFIGNCALNERRAAPAGRLSALSRFRLAEIKRLIEHRHGGACDTDDGAAYLRVAARALRSQGAAHQWAALWTPLLPADEVEATIEDALTKGGPCTADSVAQTLRVTKAEREALDLRTIGAVGFGKVAREAEQKRKARERAKAAYVPRQRRVTQEQAEPWKAEGISRRTYFYRKKQAAGEPIAQASLRATHSRGMGDAEKQVQPTKRHPQAAPVDHPQINWLRPPPALVRRLVANYRPPAWFPSPHVINIAKQYRRPGYAA